MLRHSSFRRCSFDLSVQNSGSTARDFLALERTFVSWSKLGLAQLGVAIALFTSYCHSYDSRVPHSVHPSKVVPSCMLLIGNSAFLLSYSLYRYFHVAKALAGGKFIIAKRRLIFVVAISTVTTSVALADIYRIEMKAKSLTDAARGGE